MSGQPNSSQSNTSYWSHWHIRLRQILVDYFDESELKTLCFDLRVDYESIGGEGKAEKAIELIELLVRLGRIVELIDYCSRLRPNIPWSDLREAAIGNPLIIADAPDRGLSGSIPDHQQTKRASSGRSLAIPYVMGLGAAVVVLVVMVVLFVVRPPRNPEMLPSPTPMATSTSTPTRTPTNTPIATTAVSPIPTPELTLSGTELYEANGKKWVRYELAIANWYAFPSELFVPAPDLPPCGLNTNASRTRVDVRNAKDDSYIYSFCALASSESLNSIWFAMEQGVNPPEAVYVLVIDRRKNTTYHSNAIEMR